MLISSIFFMREADLIFFLLIRNMKYRFITIICLFCFSLNLTAQQPLWYIDGAIVYTDYQSIIRVKGHMQNDHSGVFTNHGTTTIDSSYINDATTQGNGEYHVGLHWVNNHLFISDTSEVLLTSLNQLITGDSISKFYDLTLLQNGIKTQTLDARCARYLHLNDAELATDSFNMFIDNPDLAAISRNTGFVSSLNQGRLVRFMMNTGDYLFPTGSSLGVLRYRPVILSADAANPVRYGVRLANNDAGMDGYNRQLTDSNVCELNPLFYHLLTRKDGNTNCSMFIFYDPANDGDWDGLSCWHQPIPQWQDMSPVIASTAANPLNYNKKQSWTGWSAEPYILSKVRPAIPIIIGNNPVCGGSTEIYTIQNPANNATFHWSVTAGGTLNGNGQASQSVYWGFGGTSDTLSLTQTSAIGCSSWPGILNVIVSPEPVASFNAIPTTALGSIPIVFTDSSMNAATWTWDFGDGTGAIISSPEHIYNTEGTYQVMLVIQTAEGCYDTAYTTITIIDGLHIPNVFSPNGDGQNDLFEISGTNFQIFYCGIFNRWGHKVFETDNPQISWNGLTTTGSMAVEGTYFVVLRIKLLNGEDIEYGSTVNVYY